jgi:transposase
MGRGPSAVSAGVLHRARSRALSPVIRDLADEDDVDEVVDHEPKECTNCGCPELFESGMDPRRHQVTEIPPLVATITEHRLHRRICACCGEEVVAVLPPDVPRCVFGPRLQALTATLVAGYRLRRSQTSRLPSEAFGVSMSVGSVSNIEHRISCALEPALDEALRALRTSSLAHIDETPWKKRGLLHWLWTGVGDGVTVHRINRRRNREALTRLMGTDFAGIRVTDRLASYDKIPAKRRQLCWAHLERDFRAFEQGPPRGRAFGAVGLDIAQALMRCVRAYKQHAARDRFEDEVRPHLGDLIELIVDGACSEIPKVSGFAAHLLARADSLWTFVDHDGVPPTNNIAERMMTVISTKRRRAESVLDYLVEVARAAISGTPAPPLMPQSVQA